MHRSIIGDKDIYYMTPKQMTEKIEQLRVEIRWSKFELLQWIRNYLKNFWKIGLEEILKNLTKDPVLLQRLWWELVNIAPFRIKLDNLDDNEWVMVTADSVILAMYDQFIAGSCWQILDNLAYATPIDHPGLCIELKQQRYVVDDTEYCPLDDTEYCLLDAGS